jgi:alpha-mannosidase
MASDVAILHEGVFEYEVVGGHELAVTLLRCVGTISREHLATRPFQAGPGTPTPDAQMLGETAFALGVWTPATRDAVWERVEWFTLPLLEAIAVGGGDLPSSGAFHEIAGPVQLSNIRRRDDDVEIRLWNPDAGAPATGSIDGRAFELGPAEIRAVVIGAAL